MLSEKGYAVAPPPLKTLLYLIFNTIHTPFFYNIYINYKLILPKFQGTGS